MQREMEEYKMAKANLEVGMLVITAEGKARLVVLAKNDSPILMPEDSINLFFYSLN